MRTPFGIAVVSLALLTLTPATGATPVTSQAALDFGQMLLGLTRNLAAGFGPFSKTVAITLAPDDGPVAAVNIRITGPDAAEFFAEPLCQASGASTCSVDVYFLPRTPGVKHATMVVTANGHTATTTLTGTGVGGKYSGTISYKRTIVGPYGNYTFNADIAILGEKAFCQGSIIDVSEGGTKTFSLNGPGLFELRWNGAAEYEMTMSCPDPSQNHQRAEWADSFESYKQKGANGQTLKGSWSEPAPETDPINGVTGTIQMTWELVGR
jgi:hypothetical protein